MKHLALLAVVLACAPPALAQTAKPALYTIDQAQAGASVYGNMGRLSAYRASDFKPAWSFQQRSPFLTGVLSTGGGVSFVGDYDRVFRAIDTKTGETLWQTRLGTTVQGYPVSFGVDGEQYIAVTTGTQGGSPEQKPQLMLKGEVNRPSNGQAVYVFALPKQRH